MVVGFGLKVSAVDERRGGDGDGGDAYACDDGNNDINLDCDGTGVDIDTDVDIGIDVVVFDDGESAIDNDEDDNIVLKYVQFICLLSSPSSQIASVSTATASPFICMPACGTSDIVPVMHVADDDSVAYDIFLLVMT